MRSIKMKAKKSGVCTTCKGPIVPGQQIFWARGHGAHHCDCTTAAYVASQCNSCNGSGALWNNRPCPQCDGTGSAKVAEFAKSGGHKPEIDVDLLYEDDCARRCGL